MVNAGVATVKEKIVNADVLRGYEIRSDLSMCEKVRVRKLSETPKSARCGACGKRVKRHDVYDREFFDIGQNETVLVIATVGHYECPCGNCFTAPVKEVPPKGAYSYQVRQKALEGVVNDSMTFEQTRERLWRDYHVIVGRTTLSGWYVAAGLELDMTLYEEWARENFSGVVCIDEVYDTCAVLIATDPLNDFPIAYHVCENADRCTKEDVEKFFKRLNGILPRPPEITITDDSPLYRALVQNTWKNTRHQLCYFHVVKKLCSDVLKAVRELKDGVDAKECKIRETMKGTYGRRARRLGVKVDEVGSDKQVLFQHRYLLVKKGSLSAKEKLWLEAMGDAYSELTDYRGFMNDVYWIFARRVTKQGAWARRRSLLGKAVYKGYSHLVNAMNRLRDEVFKKLVPYLGYTNVPRTNNHVEGMNRKLRKMQRACYNRRVKETLEAALNHLFVYKLRKHPLYDGRYGEALVVPERGATG